MNGLVYASNRAGELPAYQFVTILRPCVYPLNALNYSSRPSVNFMNNTGMGMIRQAPHKPAS